MRRCAVRIGFCLLLTLGIAGCAGEKSAGDAMSAPAEESNAGSPADLPPAEAAPERTAPPEIPHLPVEITTTDALPATAGDPSPAPSADDDWPTFAPRHLPAEISYRSLDPAPIEPPTTLEAVPTPASPPATTPSESVALVNEIVSRLEYGTVGFYTPTELPWGETFVQEVVLSPQDTPEELRTALSNPTAPAEFAPLQIANRMEAKLTGSGFEIEPLSEPVQAITSHRPTKWRFKVTPVKTGPQELHLSLLAHIDLEGRDAPLVVETRDARIEVDITVPQRLAGMLQAHWKWLWAAVVVPTIGYFYRRKTGRKPPEQPIRHARAA